MPSPASIRIEKLTRCEQGIDDILALLLTLSAQPEEAELLLISLTFGNIEVRR
jgi:inosine-uridine nucleoside N-ribohydrolase